MLKFKTRRVKDASDTLFQLSSLAFQVSNNARLVRSTQDPEFAKQCAAYGEKCRLEYNELLKTLKPL